MGHLPLSGCRGAGGRSVRIRFVPVLFLYSTVLREYEYVRGFHLKVHERFHHLLVKWRVRDSHRETRGRAAHFLRDAPMGINTAHGMRSALAMEAADSSSRITARVATSAMAALTTASSATAVAAPTAKPLLASSCTAASTDALLNKVAPVPSALAHRLQACIVRVPEYTNSALTHQNTRGASPTSGPDGSSAGQVLLAIPGRGGVWRPAADDESEPNTPAFRRFFTMLPSVVRECLVDGAAASVDPQALIAALPAEEQEIAAEVELDVLSIRGAVHAEGCAALRHAVDSKRSVYSDSVDKMPEHQLDLSREQLEGFVGASTVAGLMQLPMRLASQRATGMRADHDELRAEGCCDADAQPAARYRVEYFVRRYSRGTRPLINFHRDGCAVTVNVALSDDAAHRGGRLLIVLSDGVRVLHREAGQATVHPSSVLHGVSAMESGVRYSLLIFFHNTIKGEEGAAAGQGSQLTTHESTSCACGHSECT